MAMMPASRSARVIAAIVLLVALAFGTAWMLRAQGGGADGGPEIGAGNAADGNAGVSDLGANDPAIAGTFDPAEQAAIRALVRQYILENPEILPEAVAALREKESRAQLAAMGKQLTEPFPGAVLGNPDGSRVLVEFADYACGYCRQSVEDVRALIAADGDLKVVVRELPILSEASREAAAIALAAAKQGKYADFHHALYAAGRPSEENIARAAREAGVDLAAARAAARGADITAELEANLRRAQEMGLSGTPAWVAGDQFFEGAIGRRALHEALYQDEG